MCRDVDLDKVISNITTNFITHSGQGCALRAHTTVHESIFNDVANGLKLALDHIKTGNPADPTVVVWRPFSEAQRGHVETPVRAGLDEDGQIEYGGGRPANLDEGYYYIEPTVFVDMDISMTLARREAFGPVAVLHPLKNDEEAISMANDSDFGLEGEGWAKYPTRALNVAHQIRTSQIAISDGDGGLSAYTSFGGYEQSGPGREWGEAGMEEHLQSKSTMWGIA